MCFLRLLALSPFKHRNTCTSVVYYSRSLLTLTRDLFSLLYEGVDYVIQRGVTTRQRLYRFGKIIQAGLQQNSLRWAKSNLLIIWSIYESGRQTSTDCS